MGKGIAAFDFDGTLTTGDCLVPFLRRMAGTTAVAVTLARLPVTARHGRDVAKERVLARLLAGREIATAATAGSALAAEVVARRLRPDTLAWLRWHQSAGHRTVIVSASLRPYLAPLAERVGVDHLICTELEEVDGFLTGRIAGGNCRGPAKAERLAAWLDGADAEIWAYGNSIGDADLLAMAHHPVRVGRRPLRPPPTAEVAS
jgi:phosphatidylglycerophosphatase C